MVKTAEVVDATKENLKYQNDCEKTFDISIKLDLVNLCSNLAPYGEISDCWSFKLEGRSF